MMHMCHTSHSLWHQVGPVEALEVRDLVVSSVSELLQPVNFRQQIGAGSGLDEEVGRSLLELLVANREAEVRWI